MHIEPIRHLFVQKSIKNNLLFSIKTHIAMSWKDRSVNQRLSELNNISCVVEFEKQQTNKYIEIFFRTFIDYF